MVPDFVAGRKVGTRDGCKEAPRCDTSHSGGSLFRWRDQLRFGLPPREVTEVASLRPCRAVHGLGAPRALGLQLRPATSQPVRQVSNLLTNCLPSVSQRSRALWVG